VCKKPSLFHQLLTSLRDQQRFGESKHAAKEIAIDKAHAEGRTGFGVAPEGVFSVDTFAGYRQVAHEFASWGKENGNLHTMQEASVYVGQYLQERIDQGKSAWTIQKDRSALRKIFRDPELAWEIEVPKRKLKNIKRSRYSVKMDQDFKEENHRDLVDFSNATGLRRHELAAIQPEDIYWKKEKLIVFVRQGKGGKAREVTVLGCMRQRLLEIISGKEPRKPMFPDIPTRMDVHSYRAKYARARIEQDGASELEVSHDLGHNRVDVIRGHYSGKR
jgi:integrase